MIVSWTLPHVTAVTPVYIATGHGRHSGIHCHVSRPSLRYTLPRVTAVTPVYIATCHGRHSGIHCHVSRPSLRYTLPRVTAVTPVYIATSHGRHSGIHCHVSRPSLRYTLPRVTAVTPVYIATRHGRHSGIHCHTSRPSLRYTLPHVTAVTPFFFARHGRHSGIHCHASRPSLWYTLPHVTAVTLVYIATRHGRHSGVYAAPVRNIAMVTRFQDPDYVNWVKAGQALLCTAEGMYTLCEDPIKRYHLDLHRKFPRQPCSGPCREEALCNVCAKRRGEWKKDVISQLTPRTVPCWMNTDKSKWETDAWEIAKVFMGPGQGAFRAGAADTDPIGLLQLVLNCQLFTTCISNRQSFDDVKEIRNKMFHSANLKLTNTEMKDHIKAMTTLLEDPAQLKNDSNAKAAVQQLQQIEALPLEANDSRVIQSERTLWTQKIEWISNQQSVAKEEVEEIMNYVTAVFGRETYCVRTLLDSLERRTTESEEVLQQHGHDISRQQEHQRKLEERQIRQGEDISQLRQQQQDETEAFHQQIKALHPPRPGQHQLYILPDLVSTSSTSSQTWSTPALHPPRPGQHQLYILPDLVSKSSTSSKTWSAPAIHPPRPDHRQLYIIQDLVSTSSTSSQTWSAPALHPPRPDHRQLYILPDLVSASSTSSQTWSAPALHPPRPGQCQLYILPDLVSTSPTSSQTWLSLDYMCRSLVEHSLPETPINVIRSLYGQVKVVVEFCQSDCLILLIFVCALSSVYARCTDPDDVIALPCGVVRLKHLCHADDIGQLSTDARAVWPTQEACGTGHQWCQDKEYDF
ncbi:hypothetical protein LSAT2_008470 [Lamellibrachia satsuma]|nr:hypothetical protein LSAT2_008470 [Lamellibrachia satsuma]